jgi:lysozyme family protein
MKTFYGMKKEDYIKEFSDYFEPFFEHLMTDEGGYLSGEQAKKIKDPGGATKYGISLRFLKSLDIDIADINNDGVIDERDIVILNKQQAKELYLLYFWNPLYTKLNSKQIQNRIFNFGVNAGKQKAVKIFQDTVNHTIQCPLLKTDGIFGEKTLKAANTLNQDKLYENYVISLEAYYRGLNKPQFLKGWLNRLRRLFHI